MNTVQQAYERLVSEEDELLKHIYTYEQVIASLLHTIYKNDAALTTRIIVELLTSIHTLLQMLQTDLLHLRIHKSKLASQLQYL